MDDAQIAIFSFGSTSRSVSEAVDMARAHGLRVGLLDAKTLWPFPKEFIKKWTPQVQAWIIPEMNLGQMANEVRKFVDDQQTVFPLNRVDGLLIEPNQILSLISKIAEKVQV
jgi:2-oxoglutarate ferredoxin oxidoreductase subunit alpha